MNYRKYFFLSCMIMFVFCGCSNKKNEPENVSAHDFIKVKMKQKEFVVPLTYKAKDQTSKERILKNLNLQLEFKIGGINDSTLLFPVGVKTDSEGNIYILDQSDCRVKKFNSKGQFLESYGKKGKGPGEVMQPVRMDVNSKSGILVLDPNLMKCVNFNDSRKSDIKLKNFPSSICLFENGFCTLNEKDLNIFSSIESYKFSGEKVLSYDNMVDLSSIKDAPPFLPTLNGEVITYNNNVYYIPTYMNHIVGFNREGKISFSIKTVDDIKTVPVVSLESMPDGGLFFRYPDVEYMTTLNCGISDGNIWILSYPGSKKYKKKVFDIYSTKDGKYLFSYITGDVGGFINVYFCADRFYIINPDASVSVMKRL